MSSGLQTNLLKHAWSRNRTWTPANSVIRRNAVAGNSAAIFTFRTPRPSSRLTAALAVCASAEQAELMLSSNSSIGSASTSDVQDGDVDLLESAASADRLATPVTAFGSETPSPSGAKGESTHNMLTLLSHQLQCSEGACAHSYPLERWHLSQRCMN